jgi:hypothetical protein
VGAAFGFENQASRCPTRKHPPGFPSGRWLVSGKAVPGGRSAPPPAGAVAARGVEMRQRSGLSGNM